MNDKTYDYLIIGQGLAGTTLAWHLIGAGKRVLLVNDSTLPSSSLVAAGIFNPLTGRKLVKTWMADAIFPYAQQFYKGLEEILQTHFIHAVNIYRPYRSIEEQNDYLAFTAEPEISKYVSEQTGSQPAIQGLCAPHGGLEVKGSGWLDVTEYIKRSKEFFVKTNQYIESDFQPSELDINKIAIKWKGLHARRIIYCQGVLGRENPLFGWLPFNPAKGQILEVAFERYSADKIVNQGVFILPQDHGDVYRVGATYSWHDLDWNTTREGRDYLESKLSPLVQGGYTIRNQRAGIRPAVKDRRPLVGMHPELPNVGIFNGLGSKGVTLAPFFANEFVQYLENGKELNPEVNIDRYFSLYYH